MPNYNVTVEYTVVTTLEVEAASADEAQERAISLALTEAPSAPTHYLDPQVTHVELGEQCPRRGVARVCSIQPNPRS